MKGFKQKNFSDICRQFNWKCTPQRMAVYECVFNNRCHPDVDAVWSTVKAKMPTVTRESIYRILNEFAGHDLIWRLDHMASARYDSNTQPHGHFICESCGTIADFVLQKDIKEFSGLVPGDVRHMEVRFTGVCSDCRERHDQGK